MLRASGRTPGRLVFVVGILAVTPLAAACGSDATDPFSGASGASSTCAVKVASTDLVAPGKLTMATNAILPPLHYKDAQGKYLGERVELGEELARRLCLTAEWVDVPGPAHQPGLAAGRWDVSNIAYFVTPDRIKVMRMIPIEKLTVSLGTTKGNPANIKKPEDLAGKRVGTNVGSFEERTIMAIDKDQQSKGMAAMKIQTFQNYDIAFQALRSGQLDAVAVVEPVMKTYQEKGEFALAVGKLNPTETAVALDGDNETLANDIVRALDAMKADGFYDKLLTKYAMQPLDTSRFVVKWDPAK